MGFIKTRSNSDSDRVRLPLRRRLVFAGLVFVGCLFAGGMTAEIVLRRLPGPHQMRPVERTDSGAHFTWHEKIGYWPAPGPRYLFVDQPEWIQLCYYNSFGMRDRERTLQKPAGTYRIAVLGDSFMEAGQVPDEATFCHLLESELDEEVDDVEVLNFGVSSVGPVQEFVIYRELVRQFNPDLVILAFLPDNDVSNSSRALEATLPYSSFLRRAPQVVREDGRLRIADAEAQVPWGAAGQSALLRSRSALFRYAYYRYVYWRSQRGARAHAETQPHRRMPAPGSSLELTVFGTYGPPPTDLWREAWENTEFAIKELNRLVTADGSDFLFMVLATNAQIVNDPRQYIRQMVGVDISPEFDAGYPAQRLAFMCRREGIRLLNLLPSFASYAKTNNLQPPYFAHHHDHHWNALAHELAANTAARFLLETALSATKPALARVKQAEHDAAGRGRREAPAQPDPSQLARYPGA